ncbi:SusC/RagA family TonB-linked outer membrane protein [Saccharicrinis sp. FJH2]|uniref:SusC/RagA family TonB-linked outer membrane protein n=1 Tax=Saccharicrinis sp. FJH65 TaxID=3344659 RepID=UPI0035F26AF3
MKIKYKILAVLLFTVSLIHAQDKVLTGKVTDAKGEPLMGCNIHVENELHRSLSGTIADMDGNYRLSVPDKPNLSVVFSFIGFESKVIPYTGQSVSNVVLGESNVELEGVTITSERIERNSLGLSNRELVTSTQTIDMKELESTPSASIEDQLQGRMANVDIITSGDPGARSSIRIRGTSSLNASSEPLIVIDGVPYPTTINDDFNFATANDEDLGALVNISPADIESIEVLKDAAATAIWGSRGANGVLIFKTKKGTRGKTRFSFNSKFDIKKEPNTIPMLDADGFITLLNEMNWNTFLDEGESRSDVLTNLSDRKEINNDPNWIYYDEYNQETNWLDEVTRTGFTTDNSFSMSGGGDKATYRISLGYLNETGTTIGTGLERFNTLIGLDYRFSDKFRLTADFSYSQAGIDSYWGGSNPRSEALKKLPNMSPYIIGDDGQRTDEYFTPVENVQGSWASNKMYNPVAMVNEATNHSTKRNGRVVFGAIYNITKGLEYRSILGMDMRTTKNKRFLPNIVTGVNLTNSNSNEGSDNLSDNMYIQTENKLIYRKTFSEQHKIILTGIFQTYEGRSAGYSSATSGSPSIFLADPTSGSNVASMGSGNSVVRNLGFISNAHYTFKDKYMISAGFRREANSSMGAENRWGSFPTVGLAWHFGDENFMRAVDWFNMGKLRLSWGQSGNAPSGSSPYIGTFRGLNERYVTMTAVEPQRQQLDNLKWETVSQTNIGMDIELIQNRLRITTDFYDKMTTDLLQRDVNIPSSTGYSQVKWYNSGAMSNRGFELIVGYDIIKSKNWSFNTDVNFSKNINKVIDLPDNKEFESFELANGNYAHKIIEGNPLGSFYGFRCLGVYQNEEETLARDPEGNVIYDINGEPVYMQNGLTENYRVYPGDAKYEDINGDGVIDKYDIVYLGNAMPLFTGGASFRVRYKNLTLSSFFHGRFKYKIINRTQMNLESMIGPNNQSTAVMSRWIKEGNDTNIPRALWGKGNNYLGSDRFVEDGTFVRLKTLSLKYAFPKKLIRDKGIDRLDLWVTGYDLFTWTNYTGQDPEVGLSNNIYLLSEDRSNTPKARRFAVGITMNF